MDGLGQLRTTWCGKSWIDHYGDLGLKTRCAQSDEYNKQRGKSGEARTREILQFMVVLLQFFRNNGEERRELVLQELSQVFGRLLYFFDKGK